MRKFIQGYNSVGLPYRWLMFVVLTVFCGYFAISGYRQVIGSESAVISKRNHLLSVKHRHTKTLSTMNNRVYASQLMQPQQMMSLLQLLMRGVDVKLISFNNLPNKPYESLYLQPAKIVVEGNYSGVVTYLERLEQSRYRILWQKLHMVKVGKSLVKAEINLQTISNNSAWINLGKAKS